MNIRFLTCFAFFCAISIFFPINVINAAKVVAPIISPTITLSDATKITSTVANLNGNITATGGKNPTVTVYWGTADGGQTPANWAKNVSLGSKGVSPFIRNITGLNPNTKYYFSAKATNSAGTSWPKASLSFTTASALSTITLSAANKVTTTTATLNGNIKATGGENPAVTVYWGTADGKNVPGNWASSSAIGSKGVSAFIKDIIELNPGTKYYFSAKATNLAGTAWPKASLSFTTLTAPPTITLSDATNITSTTATLNGNITATGGKNPTVTVYWGTADGGQTSANWAKSSALKSQGIAAFVKNITGLTPGTKYYFLAKATNSAGISWTVASLSFTTLTIPTITLSNATNITSTTATLNGDITATGGENPTVTVYWGTVDGKITPANWANNAVLSSQGVVNFLKNITDLIPNTRYYFSAKATNLAGTAWPTDSLSFTTPSLTASDITISAATNVVSTTATLNGNITKIGENNPTVTVYWGTADGGQTIENWANSSAAISPSQPQGVGAFYKEITGLIPGTKYYFSAKATNSAGTAWPSASLDFTTIDNTIYTLTITPNNGTSTGNHFSSTYMAGTVVTFTAIPTAGYKFDHWSGDKTGNDNPITITMNANKSIIANFVPIPSTFMNDLMNTSSAFLSKMVNSLKKFFTFNF